MRKGVDKSKNRTWMISVMNTDCVLSPKRLTLLSHSVSDVNAYLMHVSEIIVLVKASVNDFLFLFKRMAENYFFGIGCLIDLFLFCAFYVKLFLLFCFTANCPV